MSFIDRMTTRLHNIEMGFAELKPLMDKLSSNRKLILLEFAKPCPSPYFLEAKTGLAPGGQIVTDIEIIKREAHAEQAEIMEMGFESLYGLSYIYADDLKETEIIEIANIYADLQTVRRKSDRNDYYILMCRQVINHWLCWVEGQKMGDDPFGPSFTSRGIYERLVIDLGHTW